MHIVPLNTSYGFFGKDTSNKLNHKLPMLYSKCSLVISEAKNRVRIQSMKQTVNPPDAKLTNLMVGSYADDWKGKENAAYKKYTTLNKRLLTASKMHSNRSTVQSESRDLVVQSVKSFIHRMQPNSVNSQLSETASMLSDGREDLVRKKSIAINTTYRRGGKVYEHRVSNKIAVDRSVEYNPISVHVSVKHPVML